MSVTVGYSAGEAIGGLLSGRSTYLVGIEDGPGGTLKAYLGHRSRGVYCIVEDPEAQEAFRSAWRGGGIVTAPTPPPECLFQDAGGES